MEVKTQQMDIIHLADEYQMSLAGWDPANGTQQMNPESGRWRLRSADGNNPFADAEQMSLAGWEPANGNQQMNLDPSG